MAPSDQRVIRVTRLTGGEVPCTVESMRTLVSLPKPLVRELEEAAKELRLPKTRAVRQAIEQWVRVARFETLAGRTRRLARKKGIVSEQQILDSIS